MNGKKFTTSGSAVDAANAIFTVAVGQEIEATVTNNLKITATDGSIIVNTNSVKDGVAPVITKAELNTAKDKVTLTFSEAVTSKNDGTFGKVALGDFTFTGGAAVTAVEHDSSTPNKVVLTITGGANLDASHTITPNNFFDFAKQAVDTTAFASIKGALAVVPAAPTGVGKTDTSNLVATDGTLTGVAPGQEYQVGGTGAWIAITGTTVTGLAPGSYTVRVAATPTTAAGTATAPIVISPGSSLAPSTIVFKDGATVSKLTTDAQFTNAVSGDGDGAITYTSLMPGIAIVDVNGQVTILGAGLAVIRATKAATATHASVSNAYTLHVTAPSTVATAASTIGTVSTGGTATETIVGIPSSATLAVFKAAVTPAVGATFEVYQADGVTPSTVLTSGDKLIVTAQDGTTKVTYTLTVTP